MRVSSGELPETFRLYRPDAIVAFGPQDFASPGFSAAVEAATSQNFASVVRLAGGRAAVFHEGTLSFARAIPDSNPTARTFARFEEMAELMAAALRRLGVDARVGEVPDEYCPGEYSVNARGRVKLVGIGQRLVQSAAHVGGVVVAEGSERVRQVLLPVYDALGLSWDPATAGAVQDETGSSWEDVEEAITDELAGRFEIEEASVDRQSLSLAERLASDHSVN